MHAPYGSNPRFISLLLLVASLQGVAAYGQSSEQLDKLLELKNSLCGGFAKEAVIVAEGASKVSHMTRQSDNQGLCLGCYKTRNPYSKLRITVFLACLQRTSERKATCFAAKMPKKR